MITKLQGLKRAYDYFFVQDNPLGGKSDADDCFCVYNQDGLKCAIGCQDYQVPPKEIGAFSSQSEKFRSQFEGGLDDGDSFWMNLQFVHDIAVRSSDRSILKRYLEDEIKEIEE